MRFRFAWSLLPEIQPSLPPHVNPTSLLSILFWSWRESKANGILYINKLLKEWQILGLSNLEYLTFMQFIGFNKQSIFHDQGRQDRTLHKIHSCVTYSFLVRKQSGFRIVFHSKAYVIPQFCFVLFIYLFIFNDYHRTLSF